MINRRAVAPVVGVVLILALSLATITAIMMVGSMVLGGAQSDSQVSHMENSMAQMSSKASLVALGESPGQSIDLGHLGEGEISVHPDAGQVSVFYEAHNQSREEVFSRPFGAYVYVNDGKEIAFQGGGVWRKEGAGSTMLSPPEFHYQSQTLTFPIVRVVGIEDGGGSSRAFISSAAVTQAVYPNVSANDTFTNPVEQGTVFVEIESDYHYAWYRFFDRRTEGEVEYEPENELVRVDLSVPFDSEFDHVIATTSDNIDWTGQEPDYLDQTASGLDGYPSASGMVEDRIADCEDAPGNCESIDESFDGEIDGGTTYFSNGSVDLSSDLTFETGEGDIDIVIDGDLTIGATLDVNGTGNVTVYQRGMLDVKGGGVVNDGNPTRQFKFYLHSDSPKVEFRGSSSTNAIVYAPNTEAEIRGGSEGHGSFVFESLMDRGGQPSNFTYDEGLADLPLGVEADPDRIQYLHISDNQIEIRSGSDAS